MRRLKILMAAMMVLVLAQAIFSAPGDGKGKKKGTVPPPKFSKDVEGTFFNDAAAELLGDRPDFSKSGSTPGGTVDTPEEGGAAAGATYSWSKLISSDTLENEIKKHVAALAPSMATPSKFGSAINETRNAYSVVATMFAVIASYDGEVRWKDSAAAMRDGVARAGFNCKVNTTASFNEAKGRYEELSELLSGNKPKLEDAPAEAEWSEVADLTELMKRIELANEKKLKPWSTSKGDFTANKDQYIHEAEILAALAHVIPNDATYAGDEAFTAFANALKDGALEMAQGAKSDNFEQAQAGSVQATKACDDCHGAYK